MAFESTEIGLMPVSLAVTFLLLTSCVIRPLEQKGEAPLEVTTADRAASYYLRKPLVGTITVLTLNVAHGRKDAMNQMLVSGTTIRRNLSDIASVVTKSGADIVALQEADGPSRWSGGFDHVAELAQLVGYPWYYRAGQARSWMFDYGTAILSKYEMTEVISHSFSPTPPTLTKGFILGQISWYPNQESTMSVMVDIVSIHMDFSRNKVRQQQLTELFHVLSTRRNPVIVLGDLNSDWFEKESIVQQMVQQGGLQVFRPAAKDLGTYRKNGRRLDWILISKELEFKNYSVLPDIVSDHYAIRAEIIHKPDLGRSN